MELDDKIIKGHCPNCGSGRKAHVRCEHVISSPDEGDGTAATDTGMILECCGCERVYFRRDVWFSEWETLGSHPVTGELSRDGGVETTYWPAPIRRPCPKWLDNIERADRDLGNLMREMYAALDDDLRVVSAIAVRTVFDRASELLGVDPAINFQEKLDSLGADGKISIDEAATLEVLVDAGSAAAHRGWRPKSEELNTMVDVVESFLHRSLILGDGIAKLKAAVPAKPKRRRR
jgi:Domain of unknown function (DUF4145)